MLNFHRLSFQPLAASYYDDKCFYGFLSYLMNYTRACKCYKQALLLDAYEHFVCDALIVSAMTSFCCTDRIESLRLMRQELVLMIRRKLQLCVGVIFLFITLRRHFNFIYFFVRRGMRRIRRKEFVVEKCLAFF
jgi:hypothetical protein